MQTSSYQSYLLEQSRLYQARLYQTYLPQPFFIIFCTFCTKLIKLIFISIEFTSIYLRRKFRHWSERIPRVFWLKPIENPRRTNGDIGCPHASALECSSQTQKAISTQMVSHILTRQFLAFVQPHTVIALWGNQSMI